jgi:hypothetical protein
MNTNFIFKYLNIYRGCAVQEWVTGVYYPSEALKEVAFKHIISISALTIV